MTGRLLQTTTPTAQAAAERLLEMLADAGYMQAEPATLETMSVHGAYTFYAHLEDDLLLQLDVDGANNACRCQVRADEREIWELTYDEQGWHAETAEAGSSSSELPPIVTRIERTVIRPQQ